MGSVSQEWCMLLTMYRVGRLWRSWSSIVIHARSADWQLVQQVVDQFLFGQVCQELPCYKLTSKSAAFCKSGVIVVVAVEVVPGRSVRIS